jgi:hypothetical protein
MAKQTDELTAQVAVAQAVREQTMAGWCNVLPTDRATFVLLTALVESVIALTQSVNYVEVELTRFREAFENMGAPDEEDS